MEFHDTAGSAASESGLRGTANRAWPILQCLETVKLNYPAQPLPGPGFKILPCDQGGCLLSDEINHRILRFDASGELLWQTGGKGNLPGNFWYPRGIAIYGHEIYVCDSWNHRIQVLDLQGRPLRSLGRYGSEPERFNECSDIEVDGNGRLWVVDTGNHCLKVLSPGGRLEAVFGRRLTVHEEQAIVPGLEPEEAAGFTPGYYYPHRIAAGRPDEFCVDDRGNQRTSLVSASGVILACMDSMSMRVVRYGDIGGSQGIAASPLARLRMQRLEIADWNGTLWHSLPAPHLMEVSSRVNPIPGKIQLQIFSHDWITRDLLSYAMDMPEEIFQAQMACGNRP